MLHTGCPRSHFTEIKIAFQGGVKFIYGSVLRRREMYAEEFEKNF